MLREAGEVWMSQINLYIRQKGVTKGASVPTYLVLDLLNHRFSGEELELIRKRAKEASEVEPYDLGLVIVDFDTKTIMSAQRAFSVEDIDDREELLKEWKFVEQP